MQTRLFDKSAIGAATNTAAVNMDVSGVDILTVQAVIEQNSGALASGDAQIFVKAIPEPAGTPAGPVSGALLPSLRTTNDVPIANSAAVTTQYDVRGIKKIELRFRNNNATNTGFLTVDVYKPQIGAIGSY